MQAGLVWYGLTCIMLMLTSKMKVKSLVGPVSGEDNFTSSILLILFNCTSHVSFEIGRRRFKPGEGPIRGLLNDCETSIFAKIRLQL